MSAFGSELTPVSAYVIDNVGGIVSKSAARKRGKLGNGSLWDGAPRFRSPKHNVIYNPGGDMPDCAAQALYDAGLISDAYPDTMWQAIDKESSGVIRVGRLTRANESACVHYVPPEVSALASALGKLGRGCKKTISPELIAQRKAAGIASGKARREKIRSPF